MRRARFIFILFIFTLSAHADAPANYPLNSSLDGVDSPYTKTVLNFIQNWPPSSITTKPSDFSEDIRLHCFATTSDSFYTGILQEMWVNTSLERLQGVVDDFKSYKDLIGGFKTISADDPDKNKFLTTWEQYSGFFLIPNIKYRMIYLTIHSLKKKIYRYQLRDANLIKYSDGAIIIEDMGSGLTRYIELDFILGDSGLASTLGLQGTIWSKTVESMALSDLDFKLKAENPDWSYDKIHDRAAELIKNVPLDKVIKERGLWPQQSLSK